MKNTTLIWEEKEFQSRKGYVGKVAREKDSQLVARQWNNKDNNKHVYSSLVCKERVYTFGLEKVAVWLGEGENTVRDQLQKKTVESVSEQCLLNSTAPPPEAQTFL